MAQSTQRNQIPAGPWTRKADMPTARLGLAAAVVDNKIYAIGGYAAANHPGLTVNEVYDPASDTWETKAPMPTARWGFSTGIADNIIYVIGGGYGIDFYSSVEAYDPVKDRWTEKTGLSEPCIGSGCGSTKRKIYLIGGAIQGFDVGHPGVKQVMEYDPAKD